MVDNPMLFQFHSKKDHKRVSQGHPCFFEKYFLALKDYDGLARPLKIKFTSELFWV